MDNKTIRFLSRMGARGVLGQAVYDLANDGMFFFVLSADLARASGFDRFQNKYPERFVNSGIAEANMVGMAAGLSSSGIPVLATTWATFASARVVDQVRNYMGFMKSNVKLVGMDSGYENNRFGYTHTNGPDIAIMSAIPNIAILAPSDGIELYQAIKTAMEYNGPVYLRLTGGQTLPMIHKNTAYQFELGKPEVLRDGSDIIFISNGAILSKVLKVAERLKEDGLSCKVINVHTIKPENMECLDLAESASLIVTVEEHSEYGGIGSIVASHLAKKTTHTPLEIISSKDIFTPAGSYEYALQFNEMDEKHIYERVKKRIGVLRKM